MKLFVLLMLSSMLWGCEFLGERRSEGWQQARAMKSKPRVRWIG